MTDKKHIGECYCGSIQFEVSGDAVLQAISTAHTAEAGQQAQLKE